jgi:hypothetical protein
MTASIPRDSDDRPAAQANERALIHAFNEFERARGERDAANSRMRNFAELIELLIQGLPLARRTAFEKRFQEIKTGAPPESRGGTAYGQVIRLFRDDPRPEWAVPDILAALGASDSKPIYNALNYLTKTGRLMRLGRGRYVIRDLGVGLETSDEIAGADCGTSRVTEHDV